MKKFYESPIVELTVFDVEDVITLSAVDTLTATTETIDQLITEATALENTVAAKYGADSTYTW